MSQIKVSVVTPSFNQVQFLEQTIQSVLNQDYPNIEYIIIDGGSTDGSVELIKKYEDKITYWVSESDEGQGDAIVKGFDKASGDVFAYLNSDDYWNPQIVSRAVQFLTNHSAVDMVCGNRIVINTEGKVKYYRPWFNFGLKSPFIYFLITQESCFWRKDIYLKVGGVDKSFKFGMDYDLFARISKAGKLDWCSSLWGYFRKHSDSKTMKEFYTEGMNDVRRVQQNTFGYIVPLGVHFIVFNLYRIVYVLYSMVCRPKSMSSE